MYNYFYSYFLYYRLNFFPIVSDFFRTEDFAVYLCSNPLLLSWKIKLYPLAKDHPSLAYWLFTTPHERVDSFTRSTSELSKTLALTCNYAQMIMLIWGELGYIVHGILVKGLSIYMLASFMLSWHMLESFKWRNLNWETASIKSPVGHFLHFWLTGECSVYCGKGHPWMGNPRICKKEGWEIPREQTCNQQPSIASALFLHPGSFSTAWVLHLTLLSYGLLCGGTSQINPVFPLHLYFGLDVFLIAILILSSTKHLYTKEAENERKKDFNFYSVLILRIDSEFQRIPFSCKGINLNFLTFLHPGSLFITSGKPNLRKYDIISSFHGHLYAHVHIYTLRHRQS